MNPEEVQESEESEQAAKSAESVLRAMDLYGLLTDVRWSRSVQPLFEERASKMGRKVDAVALSLDGMIQAAYWRGRRDEVSAMKVLFTRLRERSRAVVEEAKQRPV